MKQITTKWRVSYKSTKYCTLFKISPIHHFLKRSLGGEKGEVLIQQDFELKICRWDTLRCGSLGERTKANLGVETPLVSQMVLTYPRSNTKADSIILSCCSRFIMMCKVCVWIYKWHAQSFMRLIISTKRIHKFKKLDTSDCAINNRPTIDLCKQY